MKKKDLQNTTPKTKAVRSPLKTGNEQGAPEQLTVPAPHVTPVDCQTIQTSHMEIVFGTSIRKYKYKYETPTKQMLLRTNLK